MSDSRTNFREAVFKRDGFKCVICGADGVDAHHILERRLWVDGGYIVDNGATVCSPCHIACEKTDISVEEVREAAGVKKVIPDHLYDDVIYDKWGNPILQNGNRLIGELFFDESVQKILSDKLHLFTHYVKYPRTTHVPWSPGMNDDDRILDKMSSFEGKRVIVTEKMDGENTTLYSDYIHARSLESPNHPSRNMVKNFWSSISHNIPERWRVCGENMYAKHSIYYEELPSVFLGFSLWDDKNICLGWDETLEYFELMGITPVKILYDGIYDEKKIKSLWDDSLWDVSEGYVIRLAESFPFSSFNKSVAKFVRKGHVQTTKHWRHGQKIEPNKIMG